MSRYKGSHRTDKVFCIFMEYVPGGSIASMLKQFDAFSEELIKIFTRQIVEGVMYLHAMGVVHRDIKGRLCIWKGTTKVSRALFRETLFARVLYQHEVSSSLCFNIMSKAY